MLGNSKANYKKIKRSREELQKIVKNNRTRKNKRGINLWKGKKEKSKSKKKKTQRTDEG